MARVALCVQNMSVPRDPRVWREAKALAAAGHQVTVICPLDDAQARREVLEGIDIVRYRAPRSVRGPVGHALETLNAVVRTAAATIALRRRGRLEVLHAANPPDAFFVVALLMRPLGTRFVFDQHDLSPELAEVKWPGRHNARRLMAALERLSCRTADLVIVANNTYRKRLLNLHRLPADKVVVVRNGPDRAGRIAAAPQGPPLVVAYAGVMGAHDGVATLLDAVAIVHERKPGSTRLVMIGSGDDLQRLRTRSAGLGIDGITTWAGWLSGEHYSRALHSAHVGVSPDPDDALTRHSTMIKVTEYVAGGLACLIADLPENRVTAGDAALYFKAGDPEDLARRLEQLIEQPELVQELSLKAAARGPAVAWPSSADRLVAAYRRLLDRGPELSGEQVLVG